jgi:putative flippase GtrA
LITDGTGTTSTRSSEPSVIDRPDPSLIEIALGGLSNQVLDEAIAADGDATVLRPTTGRRVVAFGTIGGFVFVLGFALQAILTSGLGVRPTVSYVIQAVVSVQTSFLLNRWLTWRDRDTPIWQAFARFNAQKVITIALNLALYAILLRFGVNYLVANVGLTIAFTIVNYVAGDRLVFVPASAADLISPIAPTTTRDLPARPTSVVIPCRDNAATIGALVHSLLAQDYPALHEIVLIGSPGDATWDGLAGIDDPRLRIEEISAPPGIRDANFKRDAAVRMTTGELIALVDSDIVLPPDWLRRAVGTLEASDASCVTGGVRTVLDNFWGRYTDNTWIGAKTPRIARSYLVTRADFGLHGRKPPITANALFTREMYDACPIDPTWSHGSYEDYEWFWRVTKSGHQILVSQDLFGWHHHRNGIRPLVKEHLRSARGCAHFIQAHPDSPLAKRRLRQLLLLPTAAAIGIAGLAAAVTAGYGLGVATGLLVTTAGLAGCHIVRSRSLEGIGYLAVGVSLGMVFTAGLARKLIELGFVS